MYAHASEIKKTKQTKDLDMHNRKKKPAKIKRLKVLIYGDSMAEAFSLLNPQLFHVDIHSFPGAMGWTLESQECGLSFLFKKAQDVKRPYDVVVLVVHHNDGNLNMTTKHQFVENMIRQCTPNPPETPVQIIVASLVPNLLHHISPAENPCPVVHLFRPKELASCWLGECNSHQKDSRYWETDGHLSMEGKRVWSECLDELLTLVQQNKMWCLGKK